MNFGGESEKKESMCRENKTLLLLYPAADNICSPESQHMISVLSLNRDSSQLCLFSVCSEPADF